MILPEHIRKGSQRPSCHALLALCCISMFWSSIYHLQFGVRKEVQLKKRLRFQTKLDRVESFAPDLMKLFTKMIREHADNRVIDPSNNQAFDASPLYNARLEQGVCLRRSGYGTVGNMQLDSKSPDWKRNR
jgi:hypothetical protein